MSWGDMGVHLERAAAGGPRVLRVLAAAGGRGSAAIGGLADELARDGAGRVVSVRALDWRTGTPGWLAGAVIARLGGGTGSPDAGLVEDVSAGLAAAPPGTVLVVERAELADEESIKAIGEACVGVDTRVLVVFVVDPASASDAARLTSAIASYELTAPEPRIDQIRDQLGARTGRQAPAGLASRVSTLSGGDAGAVTALVEELGRAGSLRVPDYYRRRVAAATAALPATTVDLVSRLAALGPEADWELLASFAGVVDPDELARLLGPACDAGLLAVDPSPGAARVRFVRPLDHAAHLAGLSPADVRDLRRQAARVLGPLDVDAALDQRVALATGPDEELARELDGRAEAHASDGAWARAAHAALAAAALSPDDASAQRRQLRGVQGLVEAGRIHEAGDLAHTIIDIAARAPGRTSTSAAAPESETARAHAVLGHLATHRGRRTESDSHLARAGDAAVSERVLHALASWRPDELVDVTAATSDGDLPEHLRSGVAAIGALGEAIRSGVPVAPRGVPASVPAVGDAAQRWALAVGWSALAADDPATAKRHLESAVTSTGDSGSERIALWAQAWLARSHLLLGTWDEALRIVDTAARRIDDLGLELLGPLVHWTGAAIRSMRDDSVGAARHLTRLRPPADSFPVQLIPSAMAEMQVAASRGDYGAVRRVGRPLVSLAAEVDIDQPGWWPWAEHYCLALVQAGRLPEAEAVLTPLWDRAVAADHASTLAIVETVRARIAGLRGHHGRSGELIESAAGRADELGIPLLSARLHFSHGRALRRSGRRREADESFGRAGELFAQMGATVYVRRCSRERRAGGVDVERGAKQDLTPQEKAVAALVAAGNGNAEVADELFLSVKTVEYHLTRIYAKLGIRGRGELAAAFSAPG